MVMQRFNKNYYTSCQIIYSRKKQIAIGKISGTKVRKNMHILSYMDDENQVMAIEFWVKNKKDNKCLYNNNPLIILIYNQLLSFINLHYLPPNIYAKIGLALKDKMLIH